MSYQLSISPISPIDPLQPRPERGAQPPYVLRRRGPDEFFGNYLDSVPPSALQGWSRRADGTLVPPAGVGKYRGKIGD